MENNRKRIKMAELVKRTGAPKSTITYYVKEGLIPAPEKTSPNMAYYDEASVERIELIKSWQRKYYPLSRIKEFIKVIESGGTPDVLMNMDQAVFQRKEASQTLYSRKEFMEATGLTKEALSRAEELKLILPLERTGGRIYDEEDARMGRILVGASWFGIPIDTYAFYAEFAEKVSEKEMALRNQLVKGKPVDVKMQITSMSAGAGEEARRYVFRRFLQKRAEAEMKKSVEKKKKS